MRVAVTLCCPLAATAAFWGAREATTGFIGAAPARWGGKACYSSSTHNQRSAAVYEPQYRHSAPWRLFSTEEATAEPEAEAPAASDAPAAPAKKAKRTPLSELATGAEFTGKVKGIKDFGVFVDFGAESDGLVHISQMSAGFVSNPGDIAKMGDVVTVRILSVDADKKQVALTMKTEAEAAAPRPQGGGGGRKQKKQQERKSEQASEEDGEEEGEERGDALKDAPVGEKDVSAFANFDPKKMIDGVVVSVQEYGAFVRLDGHDIDGLIPTTDMAGKLEVGNKVQVRVTDVDSERKRIALSNIPLLRGRRTRFAMLQQDNNDLVTIARRAGLYASELPDDVDETDNDAEWEKAFAFTSNNPEEAVGLETEDEVATFGEEPVEDDEEFAMGSIEVFRSPAYKRERGLLTEEEEAAFFPEVSAMDGFKSGESEENYFGDEDDEEDPSPSTAFHKVYESQIPQLSEEEIKGLIRKAQGIRVNVIEEWEEEAAQEREYMIPNTKPTSRKSKEHMLKDVVATTADVASDKTRVPIYFSKKMSKLKQVELLEEIEKLAVEDPLALTGRP